MRYFTEDHQWVDIEDGVATIGITGYAADELGEITFVELPEMDAVFTQGDVLCIIESVKAASDVFAPVGGTVSEVNEALEEKPGLINEQAESEGWICRFRDLDDDDLDDLMDEDAYEVYIAAEENDED